MANYEIEKGIPVFPRGKYPFSRMEIGDSFLVPAEDGGAKVRKVRSAACEFARRKSVKFTCLSVNGGLRIWRTA